MKNSSKNPNNQILLFKKYCLLQNIGGGAFGTVFLGTNIITKENVAIKVEERNKPRTTLEREAYILYYLKGPGLPEVKSFGKTKRYNILIQTLLGRSLYDIFNDCNKQFTIKDICMISIQILERLEYIHSKNYIHRDIKPHNFLVSPKNEEIIYIIDFGLAKKYKSDRGNHVKFSITKHITGTPRFCSINSLRGVEQSRRDDLESLSYLILYFLRGSLPWQGLKISSRSKRFKTISNLKKTVKLENLCSNFPPEILLFCKYTRKLGFTENPKYEYMKNLFISILNRNGEKNDKRFSWMEKGVDISNDNFCNYYLHKKSPHKRLIQKIRTSLEQKRIDNIKRKDNNNDNTLNTIFIENKNNDINLSEIHSNLHNNINNNYIQSNDNEIFQNNIIQLNIDSYKHSYNYPLIMYNKDNIKANENNFNKIAQTFQSNNTNIVKSNPINIPDKISIIEATPSNLINIEISNNQFVIIPSQKRKNILNQNKGMKLHDYIRQEEKDGGVIGKDFDFKENEFFKINIPLFQNELRNSYEIESNKNQNLIKDNQLLKKDSLKENKSFENKKLNNIMIKNSLEKDSKNKLNNSYNINKIHIKKENINKNKDNIDNKDNKRIGNYIQLNNNMGVKNNSNSKFSFQNNENDFKKQKKINIFNSHNYSPDLDSLSKRKFMYINLINNKKNISPDNRNNFNQNIKNKDKINYNSKKKANLNGIEYIKANGKAHILSNIDKNENFYNFKYKIIKNNNDNHLDTNKKANRKKQQINNENINKIINTNTYNKINIPIKKINKRKIQINNEIQINNKLITETSNLRMKDNISSNNIYKNKMDSITERNPFKINESLRLSKILNKNKSKFLKNSFLFELNNGNNRYNNSNINNYNIYKSNSKDAKNSLLFNSIDNNKILLTNSYKNENNKNIIINNLIIKNNCNKLIYNNNLVKREYKKKFTQKENNRYKGISKININSNQYQNYKPYSLRTELDNNNNNQYTAPK